MPKKALTSEQAASLQSLKQRLFLTLQFFERTQDFQSAPAWRELVDSAASNGDLRNMRLLAKEVDAMTVALPSHERDGLEALLLSRLGVDKEVERAELQRHVAKVLERGTIASEKERRHLEDYAEMLEATGGDPAEIEAVRQLIQRG